jgi:membrane-associated phospholipid phosphatase
VDAAGAFLSIITNLGDAGFLLPASFALGVVVWLSADRRTAIAFACAFSACVGATMLAKVAFMTCAGHWAVAAIHSPSGHASLATMFFLSLGLVGARSGNRLLGRTLLPICLLLVALIAASRIALGAHTAAETLAGAVVGVACFGVFWRFASLHLAVRAPALAFGLAPLVVAYVAFGAHVGIEDWLERIAAWLAQRLTC